MEFIQPKGMVMTEPVDNRQMNYEYALKIPKKKMEVRYAIRPLDNFLKEYEEFQKNKKEGDVMLNPNELYSSMMLATLMNISGGQMPEINEFDEDAVKEEFNADWGATAFVEAGKEFGQDYKFCLMVAIHKNGFADAYYFYMANTKGDLQALMGVAFHSLKFKY